MNASYTLPQTALVTLGFLMYLLAAVLGMGHLVWRSVEAARFCRLLAGGGLLAHGSFLLVLALTLHSPVPVTTRFESLIFVVSILVLASLLFDALFHLRAVTGFVLPLVTVLSAGAAGVLSLDRQAGFAAEDLYLSAHIGLTLLSYAAFTLGFIFGVMYLTLERQLKAKRMGWLFDLLPPLEVVDRLSARVVESGFALLTVGIALGLVGTHRVQDASAGWRVDPKVLLSGITWILYLVTILLRRSAGFRGRKATYLTVLGFVFVLFTYFGANLLGAGFHQFG
ncbi:MAG: cytochrome c biogenesis protein CcsA [Planctomycetes bacterium]|nr:cytochrome c biogenesis protein CcsA [Planctomycetota bacterium]